MVKNPPAKQETRVQSLVQEDPLEKKMTIPSRILAWEIPWGEEPERLSTHTPMGRCKSLGSLKSLL